LFATLARSSISVAAKGLKAIVGGPDLVGISAPRLMWNFEGQWKEVSKEKNRGSKPRRDQRAEMGFAIHGRE
jgi:hypothetical protein